MKSVMNQCLFPAKIGAGRFALEHLPFDLGSYGASRPMVICSEEADSESTLAPLADAFRGSGISLGVFSLSGDATPETVKEAWGHFSEGGFDSVIAVGGGVIMDVAKALCVAGGAGPDALRNLMQGGRRVVGQAPLAWVPTLDLDGFETTPSFRLKGQTLEAMEVAPRIITIDPRMMSGKVKNTLSEAALRAFVSALCLYEADISATLSRPYAHMVAGRVLAGLFPLLAANEETPGLFSRLKARWFTPCREEEMAFVTALALSGSLYPALKKSLTGHLAHSLSEGARVSEPVLAAVLLPSVLEYAHKVRGEDLSDLLLSLGDRDTQCATPRSQRSEKGLSMIREALNRLWFVSETASPRTLSEAGVEIESLADIGAQVAESVTGWQPHEVEALLVGAYTDIPFETRTTPVKSAEEVA
ncbi:MAG: iron-containing alcohol dehydrogenase [Desulfobacterales bacterium]|nr:iron-containing alcohol dehydrogenase [Desulfobacterales bacterium]